MAAAQGAVHGHPPEEMGDNTPGLNKDKPTLPPKLTLSPDIQKLQAQLEALTEENRQLAAELSASPTGQGRHWFSSDDEHEDGNAPNHALSEARNELGRVQRERGELHGEVGRLRAEKNLLGQQLSNARAQVAQLSAQLSEQAATMGGMQARIATRKAEHDEALSQQRDTYEERIAKLMSALERQKIDPNRKTPPPLASSTLQGRIVDLEDQLETSLSAQAATRERLVETEAALATAWGVTHALRNDPTGGSRALGGENCGDAAVTDNNHGAFGDVGHNNSTQHVIDRLREQVAETERQANASKAESVAAVNALLDENDELRRMLDAVDDDLLHRTQRELKQAEDRILVLERAIHVLEETVLYERELRQKEATQRQQSHSGSTASQPTLPPTAAPTVPSQARGGKRRHVVCLDGVKLGRTALTDAMDIPSIVNVRVSRVSFSLLDGDESVCQWPLTHLRQYGLQDDMCVVRFGRVGRHPGTLVFPDRTHARVLFRLLRNMLDVSPTAL
eukprot:m.198943 g.198943  ORF g.198943 m.198943 type:complete len:508 (+) comp20614_c0_seq1:66-1589(+)